LAFDDRGKIMKAQSVGYSAVAAIGVGLALALLGAQEVLAQEKCQMSWETSGANAKYTEQHVMDVGDVPGHQIRLFELHRTFPDDQVSCEGHKLVEQWRRGYSDYIDRNGRAWGYDVITLDNGDKIFSEWSGTSQTVVQDDGSSKSIYTGIGIWNGGTGRYQGVRGIQRDSTMFDPDKQNFNESRAEVEYWFEK
jgi:hypothetical protein